MKNYNRIKIKEEPCPESEVEAREEVSEFDNFEDRSNMPITGTVSDCEELFVREGPSKEFDAICTLKKGDTVTVYPESSSNDFYKVCTFFGVEGYCMKSYINVGIMN